MAALNNLTPFSCVSEPHVDVHGIKCQLLIIKGVWNLQTNRLADDPGVLRLRTTPWMRSLRDMDLEPVQRHAMKDRLDETVEWLSSDLIPPKPRFDLLVCGHAYSRGATLRDQFVAAISFESRMIGLSLHAPRYWLPTLVRGGGAIPDKPLRGVTRVPLHHMFAYGGDSRGDVNLFNPQGMGSPGDGKDLERKALPWIEHPDQAVSSVTSDPPPVGFGLWPENAAHRLRYMGTYDKAWRERRAPRKPLDFNPLFHNQAEPRLQWDRAPKAGQHIDLHHLSAKGAARIVWPRVRPSLQIDQLPAHVLDADTCLIAPDEGAYALVWRALAPAGAAVTLRAVNP